MKTQTEHDRKVQQAWAYLHQYATAEEAYAAAAQNNEDIDSSQWAEAEALAVGGFPEQGVIVE